jgi:hypothetical protein
VRVLTVGLVSSLLVTACGCSIRSATMCDSPTRRDGGESKTIATPRRFLELGLSQSYTLLRECQRDVDEKVNTTVRTLSLRSHDVTTFQDWSRDGKLLLPFVGLGYHVSEHWSLGFQIGASAGVETAIKK